MKPNKIIQSIDGAYVRYMNLSRPVHERYAAACEADYELFIGTKDEGAHPAWNRLPMFLEAFAAGYDKVVWLDADTLVVNQEVDIFAETDDVAPLRMTRVTHSHVEIPWGEDGWDVYNDGVIVANNTPEAIDACEFVWANRCTPFKAHHHPTMWELNWVLDWIFTHREHVALLDQRFNWMPFIDAPPENEAVIKAWHGMPHDQRWAEFTATYAAIYG